MIGIGCCTTTAMNDDRLVMLCSKLKLLTSNALLIGLEYFNIHPFWDSRVIKTKLANSDNLRMVHKYFVTRLIEIMFRR